MADYMQVLVMLGGATSCSVCAVQLFGCVDVLETHIL